MSGEVLFEAFGHVDENYVLQAGKRRRQKNFLLVGRKTENGSSRPVEEDHAVVGGRSEKRWLLVLAVAACLTVLVLPVLFFIVKSGGGSVPTINATSAFANPTVAGYTCDSSESTVPSSSTAQDPYSGMAGDEIAWRFEESTGTLILAPDKNGKYGAVKDYDLMEEHPWESFLEQIRYLVVEEGVTHIGRFALYDMPNLQEVTLPSTLYYISHGNFIRCGMESIVLLEDTMGVESDFGCECPNLKTVIFQSPGLAANGEILKDSPKLESIQFGGYPAKWEEYVLAGNPHLRNIPTKFAMDNPVPVWNRIGESNIEWNLDKEKHVLTIRGKGEMPLVYDNPWRDIQLHVKTLIVEEGVTKLGASPSFDAINLTKVSLPNSLETLENMAFRGCDNLESIEFPDKPEFLPDTFFSGSNRLRFIKLPKNLKAIGLMAFHNCTSLVTIDIPDSVTTIEIGAFQGCTALETIELPKSLSTISYELFLDCSSLKSVTIPESVTYIGDDAFKGCSSLEVIYYGGSKAQWEKIYISHISRLPEDIRIVFAK